jgi:GNAT superfamily N-acetyltransferase
VTIRSGVVITDLSYLRLATTLLQRMRLATPAGGITPAGTITPAGGIWEAADIQWWWRQERTTDRDGHLFWLDEDGEPLAAVIRTDFGHSFQCDVLILPNDPAFERTVWQAAIAWTNAATARTGAASKAAEFPVRADDTIGAAELAAAGFGPDGQPCVVSCWLEATRWLEVTRWLEASDQPAIPALVPGYRLHSRVGAPDRPHPLAARNGAQVEQRLRQCSLYRPELDLMVEAPDGQIAAYGLFWADPVTGVGLVEPMRTEHAHQGRGIASHLLAAGLDRLAAYGCRQLKVSNDIGLYLRAGFRPVSTAPVLRPVSLRPLGSAPGSG